jgi:signal transduction histidine kinase
VSSDVHHPSARFGGKRRPDARFRLVLEDDLSVVPAGDAVGYKLEYRDFVRDRAWSWLRRNAADVVIALLAVATEIELAVTNAPLDYGEVAPLSFFFVLPLLARRRFPLFAPAFALGALTLAATLDTEGLQKTGTPFFDAIACAIAMGAIVETGRRAIGYVLTIAAVTTVALSQPGGGIGDVAWICFFFTGAWIVGYAIATRTRQTHELRERAERAERERERLAAEAVAEERARIARELHDVVAHSVSVMVVQAAGVRRLLQPEQEREREALQAVERIGREALTEMRRMLGVLRAGAAGPELAPQPGLEHLDRLIEQVRRAGVHVDVEVTGARVALPPGLDLSAYRIVQEGLTNALKHGGGRARVCVRYGDGELELEVVDATPFPAAASNGQGLAGMRERVAVYGGEFEAGPAEGGGFRVRARLPIAGLRP